MTSIRRAWWAVLALVSGSWLLAEVGTLAAFSTIPVRSVLLQYSGLLAMSWMSVAMILATRTRWAERRLGGLDKMYRLHKWVGVSALVVSVAHWLTVHAAAWASVLGRPPGTGHGPRAVATNPIEQWLRGVRGEAEIAGEWAFYGVVILVVVSLATRIPYRLFYKSHRLLAVCYLALVVHTVVLTKFSYWSSPVALILLSLLVWGTWASVIVLGRRVGRSRQTAGTIVAMKYYPGVHALEVSIEVANGWPGHEPGQFAFVTSNASEGAHPYTMASAWDSGTTRLVFVVKELGDHTTQLRTTLQLGQSVKVEGPYGQFTFADTGSPQIWVGGGVGITPFIARMKYLASQTQRSTPQIDLFHATAETDDTAFGKLQADADASGVQLHLLVDARDGFLTAARICDAVPAWRDATVWFCGPTPLRALLRRDLARRGFDVDRCFHYELFALR